MVVLDADQGGAVEVHRVLGGQVLRVQVMRDQLGGDPEQPPEVPDALGERPQRLVVLQVTDVVREERPVLAAQAERVLQLGAAGQHRAGEAAADGQRLGHVAAGAAQHGHPAAQRPDHRVVGPDMDGPVVAEEGVRDAAEPAERVVVGVGDRLVGHVAAGQHERAGHVTEQQVVQRRVRQHQAEMPVTGRHRVRDRCRAVGPPGQQHDRPRAAGQHPLRGGIDLAQRPRGGQVADHHRERLVLAVLAGPQPGRGVLAGGVGGQVVPAEALDRQHLALAQRPRRRGQHAQPPAPRLPRVPPPGRRHRPSRSHSRGPQAGQQVGWAWNRRSAGSWYSAAQAGHMVNAAIVVSGRS